MKKPSKIGWFYDVANNSTLKGNYNSIIRFLTVEITISLSTAASKDLPLEDPNNISFTVGESQGKGPFDNSAQNEITRPRIMDRQ